MSRSRDENDTAVDGGNRCYRHRTDRRILRTVKGGKVFKKLWWIVPLGAAIMAVLWLTGAGDGTSLIK